jgi:hypothetical protein
LAALQVGRTLYRDTVNDIPISAHRENIVMSVAFNQASADELIQKLGSTIIAGKGYEGMPWQSLSLILDLSAGESQFGYVYYADNEWEAATPRGFESLDVAIDLRDAMHIPGKEAWKKALVQITRSTGKIDIAFDYDGDKWVPNMADPKSFAMSVRPTQ